VASDGEAALLDTGIGSDVDGLLANVEAAGLAPEAIALVLLTHAHPDHAGGAADLARRLEGARFLASEEVAGWVREGNEEAMSLAAGKRAELYPSDYRFERCRAVGALAEGERLRVGRVELEAIRTPGHSAGHLAFLTHGARASACFCGDLVFYGGQISLEANWDCSLADYARSVRRLAERRFDALLPGHHSVSLRRGRRHVEAAARQFARGFVPRSVV
jgi:hydroxyacylglutathione hydrolase